MCNVRKQMLNGEKSAVLSVIKKKSIPSSNACGKQSWLKKRVDLDKLLRETNEDGSVRLELAYIDLRFGTKCRNWLV